MSLQRHPPGHAEPATVPPIVYEVLRSPGQPLDAETRAFFESRFGHDFSQVRVHTDGRAAESARTVNASAYTVGRDLVFDAGRYAPATERGRLLLAHELAHTLQQSTVSQYHKLSVSQPGDAGEQVADRIAGRVAGAEPEPITAFAVPPTLQRQQAGVASPAQAGPQPLPGEPRLIASFDVDPGTKRPWNLDQLTRTIVQALSASELAYVRILGVYPTKAGEDDPKGMAYQRADTVRRALIQWIGPKKFSEDRFDVAFADGSIGDPQIQVEIWYKPRVVSEPRTTLPEPRPGPRPLAPLAPRPSTKPSPATPSPPSLIPSPYPGRPSDVFSAFLVTPLGEKFKAAALAELKRVWKTTSIGEKIGILVHLLATLGAATYGLATMSPAQQKGILDLIIGDEDTFLQRPLPAKTFPFMPFEFKF